MRELRFYFLGKFILRRGDAQQWVEVDASGREFATFTLVLQSDTSVIIYDQSRDLYIKLTAAGAFVSNQFCDFESPLWNLLKLGSWRRSASAGSFACCGLPSEMATLMMSSSSNDGSATESKSGDGVDALPSACVRWEIGSSSAFCSRVHGYITRIEARLAYPISLFLSLSLSPALRVRNTSLYQVAMRLACGIQYLISA